MKILIKSLFLVSILMASDAAGVVITEPLPEITYSLVVTSYPEGSGRFLVSSPPRLPGEVFWMPSLDGYEYNVQFQAYLEGDLTITAIPISTNKFYGWSGSVNGVSNQLSFSMNGNKTIRAFFIDSSLVWQHSTGTLATWFMDGANLLGSTYLNHGNRLAAGWRMIAAYDFNGDSSKDFLFQHSNGQLAIWFMDGNALKNSQVIGNSGAAWRAVALNDFNDDGKTDILFQHNDSRLAVWFMDGTTYKSSAFLNGGKPTGVAWKAVGAKDLNADGNGDILFQHTNGPIAFWLMNQTSLTSSSVLQLNPGPKWRVAGFGDFNSDTKTDFLFQHTTGVTAVWFMNGTNYINSAYLNNGQPIADWKIGAVK